MKKLLYVTGVTAAILIFVGSSLAQDITGRYVYKTYRKGKGGYVNSLEVTNASKGRFHVSFEGTYFYMAGKAETFHEGSGEGDGQINGNVLTATLDDGAGGSCRLTLNFRAGQVTLKSAPNCQINVVPDGIYRKDVMRSSSPTAASQARAPNTKAPAGLEVCPDPDKPCHSRIRKFAAYELPFRLPATLKPNREYKSAPFYAVILRTYDDEACDADDHTASIERQRLQMQKEYPGRKVFAEYSCPNLDAVGYDFQGKMDASRERVLIMTFIAVYAGKTAAEANEFLVYVQTVYPRAVLKRMTASYEIIDQ